MNFHRIGVRKKVAAAAFTTLRSAGVFSLAGRSDWRTNKLLILCFHGLAVNEEHKWRPDLYITPEQFQQRLALLRKAEATVLGLDEGLTRLREGSLPPRSVVITFDDGFHDFLEGVPALSSFGFPSTLYLTTHYSDHRLPIVTLLLDYLLWKSGEKAVRFPEFGIEKATSIAGYSQRQQVVLKLLAWMEEKDMGSAAKDEVAQAIAKTLGVDYGEIVRRKIAQVLDPEQVHSIVKAGVDVQLHTHRHRTPLDRALFTREIIENRDRIRELTGKTPDHFCYPSGVYHREFFPWLAECGVKSATTCERGIALPTSEMMRLPRLLDDCGMDPLRFEAAIAGIMV